MRMRIAAGLVAIAAGLALMLDGSQRAVGQDKKDPPPAGGLSAPKFIYGHDLKVRPGGEFDWGKAVKIGFEVYQDEETQTFIGITEKGSIAVVPGRVAGKDKRAKWLSAQDLNVRAAGMIEFKDSKKYGVEMFRDYGSNRLLYMCQTGSPAFASIPPDLVTDQKPKWHHAMEPRVRAPGETNFEKAKKVGLEVFKDWNTKGLIYITEAGSIATGPAPEQQPEKPLPPKAEYGLELRVRGADEPDFTDKTRRIGVEVFTDPNANDNLMYITESGSIAVAPKLENVPADAKGVTWKRAMSLKARQGGEASFDKAKKYGIEVFEDNRTGNLIFISETGSISVVPK